MTFNVLHNSPEVAPLLVRLYDTHNVLIKNKHSEKTATELTDVMVDLLNMKLSDKESELITDVLLALMKQAERDLKAALAQRLSVMNNVPLRIVLGLANEEVMIADSILRNSPVLHDMDLMYILHANGVGHGRSIARRAGLSGAIINMLADTKDLQIAVNLSENDNISLTPHAFETFLPMAKDNRALATPLLAREDVPQEVAGILYEFVGTELKKTLSERFGISADEAAQAIDHVVEEMSNLHAHEDFDAQHAAFAEAQHAQGRLTFIEMIETLRRSQYSTFLAQFCAFSALPAEKVKTILRQENAKALSHVCRALGVAKADFVSLYLLTERFRKTGRRMADPKELSRIMTQYEAIDIEDARAMMAQSRH